MKIAVFSDVHGNLPALEAVLQDIERQGVEQLVCAGDLALFGPHPRQVFERLRGLKLATVGGNTDVWLLQPPEPASEEQRRLRALIDWTRAQLGPEDFQLLEGLPRAHRLSPAPGHDLLVVHANPKDLDTGILPETPEDQIVPLLKGVGGVEVLAFGHVHVPFTRQVRGWTLVEVGYVGLPPPQGGDPQASYTVFIWNGRRWQHERRSVAYDVEAFLGELRRCGMPHAEGIAARFRRGG